MTSARPRPGVGQRIDLCVGSAGDFVTSSSHDHTVSVHDDGADHRIGTRAAASALGEPERLPHVILVVHSARAGGLSSAFYLLPSAFCLLPSAFCLLPSAFCLLPSAFCFLPSASCLLPTAFCLLPTEPTSRHPPRTPGR